MRHPSEGLGGSKHKGEHSWRQPLFAMFAMFANQ
ncbi:hypothetical protein PSYAC_12126 [Pseudomonas syringae pv. actinidiae str. M302091]|nr:hypothetical protein PSYAC_12126 [Pseudomonas syringae pv. actinidiae str. M302091]